MHVAGIPTPVIKIPCTPWIIQADTLQLINSLSKSFSYNYYLISAFVFSDMLCYHKTDPTESRLNPLIMIGIIWHSSLEMTAY